MGEIISDPRMTCIDYAHISGTQIRSEDVRGCQRVYGAQNLASLVQRQVPGLGTQSIHDGLLQVLTRKTS